MVVKKNKKNTDKTRDPMGSTTMVTKNVVGFSPLLCGKEPPFHQRDRRVDFNGIGATINKSH